MAAIAFDTLAQAENLKRYGFEDMQAKGLVEVIALCTNDLATKQDVEQIRQEMKQEMECLRLETRLEIQHECNDVRRELIQFKEEVRGEFTRLDKKILQMTISLASVLVVALGVYTSILQWLLK